MSDSSPYREPDKDLIIFDLKKQIEELKNQLNEQTAAGYMHVTVRSVFMANNKEKPYAFQLDFDGKPFFHLGVTEYTFLKLKKPNVGDEIKVSFSR